MPTSQSNANGTPDTSEPRHITVENFHLLCSSVFNEKVNSSLHIISCGRLLPYYYRCLQQEATSTNHLIKYFQWPIYIHSMTQNIQIYIRSMITYATFTQNKLLALIDITHLRTFFLLKKTTTKMRSFMTKFSENTQLINHHPAPTDTPGQPTCQFLSPVHRVLSPRSALPSGASAKT